MSDQKVEHLTFEEIEEFFSNEDNISFGEQVIFYEHLEHCNECSKKAVEVKSYFNLFSMWETEVIKACIASPEPNPAGIFCLKVGNDFYDLEPLEQDGEYLVKKMYYADLRWAMQENMPCILKANGEKIQFHFKHKHNLPEQKDEVSVVDPLKLAALSADNGCKMEVLDQKTAKQDNWLFVDKVSLSDNRYLVLFCDINTYSVMVKLKNYYE